MWIYSWHELVALTAAALVLDWLIGDPKWPTHPVIYIGRWVRFVERRLRPSSAAGIGGKVEAGTSEAAREEVSERAAGYELHAVDGQAVEGVAGCKPGVVNRCTMRDATEDEPETVTGRASNDMMGPDSKALERMTEDKPEEVAGQASDDVMEHDSGAVEGMTGHQPEGVAERAAGDFVPERATENPGFVKMQGVVLTATTVLLSFGIMYGLTLFADWIHPWLGYAVTIWFIASTVAVKGLKQAAYLVREPLRRGDLEAARMYTGYIVGRNTACLDEAELTRAVVETVAENIVDAVIAPLFYAVLGGAPLAMAYRAANTLDSMVGYRNAAYRDFGWASARWDDVLNWVPARLTGALLVGVALLTPGLSAQRAARAIRRFARLHPSPNSGIPESAAAGALGIELGGLNVYGGVPSERARLGWPLRERTQRDIVLAVRMMYGVSLLAMGGLLCACALHWL